MDPSSEPPLMLFICQDKPIPRVRFSLKLILSSLLHSLFHQCANSGRNGRASSICIYKYTQKCTIFNAVCEVFRLFFLFFLARGYTHQRCLQLIAIKNIFFPPPLTANALIYLFISSQNLFDMLTGEQTESGKDVNASSLSMFDI